MRHKICGLLLMLVLLPAIALAHKPSDSFLTLDLRTEPVQLRWDIALRDLDHVLGLDLNGDRALTWAEVSAAHARIADYASKRLRLGSAAESCTLVTGPQQLAKHSDGSYSVLSLDASCPDGQPTGLQYSLLFDVDPTHRGLLRVQHDKGESQYVLGPEQASVNFDLAVDTGTTQTLLRYLEQGVLHIWLGLDHVLFLLTLLLPVVLLRQGRRWQPAESRGAVAVDVLAVVTTFTVAHSLTLALAVLQVFTLPSQWVESAIAATVVLVAINNLYPILPGPRWAVVFILGLVHGFGFASVLIEFGLPNAALLPALLGFNLGMEIGQLIIVVLFVPLIYLCRRSRWYRMAGLQFGSTAIAVVALVWLAERGLNLELIP